MDPNPLYPPNEPYADGMLAVDQGHDIYWETCGAPGGQPVVVLHGGPGSGCTPWHRRLFDPDRYRIVLFDQRGCGRSTPHAGEADADLSTNTTASLVDDIERLREHLEVERWVVWGGSWGSALALAYAEANAARVSGMLLWGVTTGRRSELDWLFRGGLARLLPEQWERLRAGVPEVERDEEVPGRYATLLFDPDPRVRERAASAWCLWESAAVDWPPQHRLEARFRDPAFALAFSRLVTHYVSHDLFLGDDELLTGIGALSDVPAVMVQGRFDLQSPLGNAWTLHRAWPGSELIVADEAGHAPDGDQMASLLVAAGDQLAR